LWATHLIVCTVGHMQSKTDSIVAANVATIANAREMPMKALASGAGISYERLRLYLTGTGTLLAVEVRALADALGVTDSDLMREVA